MIQYLKILEQNTRPIKKKDYHILSFIYSILSWGSLCMNYCINAAKPVTSPEKEITISIHRLEMVISFSSRT